MWIISKDCHQRFPSSKNPPRIIRVPLSVRLLKFMIICACCLQKWVSLVARNMTHVLEAQTISQMVDTVLALPEDTKIMILAPVVRERKGEHVELLQELRGQGFVRARIDGEMVELDQAADIGFT